MTHGSHPEPDSRQRWLLACLVALTLLFGFWGNWIYEREHHPEHPPDVLSILYHSSQFLIAHAPHLEGGVPWQLHVGRLLGLAALFTAGVVAFTKFFRDETLWLRLWAPWQRDHVVVCGLGDLGHRLASDAQQRGKLVVAIERRGEQAAIERARRRGILVLEGDACDVATLRKARVQRAEFVVAACRYDATNVAIAATVGQVLAPAPERAAPLVCRLLVQDHELRRLLEKGAVFGAAGDIASQDGQPSFVVNLGDLNLQETAARQVLRLHPLDFQPIHQDDDTIVHLLVAGSGPMGQHIALQAARIGHFANAVTKERKLRITVVDRGAAAAVAGFRHRCSKINRVCDLGHVEADLAESAGLDVLGEISRQAAERKELVTCVICLEAGPRAADRENLRIGLELEARVQQQPVQLLAYQSTRCGFAALFPAESAGAGRPALHAFGMIEDIYSWDVLLHESEDRLARAIHEDYAAHRRREGQYVAAWESLPENFRESNRHAADHIPIKLRALGYHVAPLQAGRPRIESFADEEVLLLAQMEHRRWCAERWLDGWEYGPDTIKEQKINRDLTDWDKLPEGERKKDYEQIRAIPRLLQAIGLGIYR